MGLFGRGALKDINKLGLNTLAAPAEMITGQNLYNPDVEGNVANDIEQVQEGVTQAGSAMVPMVAGAALGPVGGMAVGMGRGMLPSMGASANGGGWDPNSTGAKIGQFAGTAGSLAMMGGLGGGGGAAVEGAGGFSSGATDMMPASGFGSGQQIGNFGQNINQMGMTGTPMFPFGGALPYEGQQQFTGGNLAAFNGPSHEDGGINYQGKAEIELKETVDMEGNYVYSDKFIVPGSKKTFAEASKKYKGKDTDDDITKNTNKLMLNRLKGQQEEMRKEKFEKEAKRLQKKNEKFMAEYGGQIPQYPEGGFIADPNMGNVPNFQNTDRMSRIGTVGTAWEKPDFGSMTTKSGRGWTPTQAVELQKRQADINRFKNYVRPMYNESGRAIDPNAVDAEGKRLIPNSMYMDYLDAVAFRNEMNPGSVPNTGGSIEGTQLKPHEQLIGPNILGTQNVQAISTNNAPAFEYGGHLPTTGINYGGKNYGGAGVNYGGGFTQYAFGGPLSPGMMQAATDATTNPFTGGAYPTMGSPNIGSDYVSGLPEADFSQAGSYINSPVMRDSNIPSEASYTNAPMSGGPSNRMGGGDGSGFNVNQAAMAVPGLFALAQGMQKPESYMPQVNPQYSTAINQMSNRRYDAQPEIMAAKNAQRQAGTQARQAAGGNAALELAMGRGALVDYNRAERQALANQNNMNNQYLGEEARFRAGMGSEHARNMQHAYEMNMRGRAKGREYMQKGADYIGMFGQLGQQNQIYRDLIDTEYGGLKNGAYNKVGRRNRKSK